MNVVYAFSLGGNDNRSPGNNGDIKKEPVQNDGDDKGQVKVF